MASLQRAPSEPKRLAIGIRAEGFLDWTGGTAFLCGVMAGLREGLPDSDIHLLIADRGPRASLMRTALHTLNAWKRIRGRPVAALRRSNDDIATPSAVRVEHIDVGASALARAAQRLRLDLVIPSIHPLPKSFSVPWVGYIYDFQHRHLPQLFSAREIRIRDDNFGRSMRDATTVIVNSRDTARVAAEIYPEWQGKLHPLPFCACPDPAWLTADDHDLPWRADAPFFIISNQFWVHKNHETAFRALAMLPSRYSNVALVCTGHTTDYRSPTHFPNLMKLVGQLGLMGRVHVLGLLPKDQQIALMKRAVAVIQPTLCEGGPGGGATYDAVGLGVPAIISDIPINRELGDEPAVTFFKATDADHLAAAMTRLLDYPRHRDPPETVLARGKSRWKNYTAALRSVVAATVAS